MKYWFGLDELQPKEKSVTDGAALTGPDTPTTRLLAAMSAAPLLTNFDTLFTDSLPGHIHLSFCTTKAWSITLRKVQQPLCERPESDGYPSRLSSLSLL